MSNLELLQKLRNLDRSYYTTNDLGNILGSKKPSLYVLLSRLIGKNILRRVRRGVYAISLEAPYLEKIANEIYYPSYISFECALNKRGVIDQIPYTLTLATTRPPKKMRCGDREIVYHQLKPSLFFGFVLEKGIYLAEAEKAVLDQLYLISKGIAFDSSAEWDLSRLKKGVLRRYAKKFPRAVSLRLEKLL